MEGAWISARFCVKDCDVILGDRRETVEESVGVGWSCRPNATGSQHLGRGVGVAILHFTKPRRQVVRRRSQAARQRPDHIWSHSGARMSMDGAELGGGGEDTLLWSFLGYVSST